MRSEPIAKFDTYRKRRNTMRNGFALVVTLSLMILLTVIAVGLLTLSSISLRSSSNEQAMSGARANARLAVILALGELQKSAGPDQRVTAAAEILTTAPAAGRAHWTGVWDTSEFKPSQPDTKALPLWLVSSSSPGTPSATANATGSPSLADVKLFTGVNASGAVDEVSSVKVPRVGVSDGSGGSGAYAYWVEDEGLKADMGWSESDASTDDKNQAARLSVAPGPDYKTFEGPFASDDVSYPISANSGNAWLGNMDKAISAADMPLVMGDATIQDTWLKMMRHDMTLGSRGVIADVKFGGLRRDLSLAFEMDGDADVTATSQPTKFNQQDGEFVGGNDRLTAPFAAMGMGNIKERFLYRDTKSSGTLFSGNIARSDSVVRGPNWWALRDYANLYKRLSGSDGDYTLEARSHYPNVSALGNANYNLGFLAGTNSSYNAWDGELNDGDVPGVNSYVYRPARSNYAPVVLGSVCLFSGLAAQSNGVTANLALGIDPFFYLWNPYNRTITADKFAITADHGFPGHITFYVTRNGVRKQYGPSTARDYLSAYATGSTKVRPLTYLVSDLTMAPGEIIVVSPSSNRSASANVFNDEALPGTNTDNASGVILTKIPVSNAAKTTITWQEVPLLLSLDTVEFSYSNKYQAVNQIGGVVQNSNWFWLRSSLPASATSASSLSSAINYGDQLQALDSNTMGGIGVVPEYYYPGQNEVVPPVGPYNASTLANTKNFFGIVSYLAKPASFTGQNPNPVEVFSQFNPAPVGSTAGILWRPCHLNQIFNMVSRAGGANTLLSECAINFPATAVNNGFWGESYSSGSTSVPMSDIPSAPLLSLASFSNAALSILPSEPYHAVGNSWSNLFVSPVSPYGIFTDSSNSDGSTAADTSWLLNDALFDRYFLSGFAPEYTINGSGYSETGSLSQTLTDFYGPDYRSAHANPVLRPYLPSGTTASDAVAALDADDGYKKTGAYSLIDGVFNVNSTSVAAWTAFLRGNRNLEIKYAQSGGADTGTGSPFPSNSSPVAPGGGGNSLWSGFSRLSDSQVESLAREIVAEVKLRGPFMSLSNFVNHRVGTPKTDANYMGALQAAIEKSGINSSVVAGAGGVAPVYGGAASTYFPDPPPVASRKTTTGIATDITQADLLRPLAPRLNARSDTFRIRGYGEVRSKDGTKILASATCEAIVQRLPEYMDPNTDASNNEPWDEATDPITPTASKLNSVNQVFGRRFNVVGFRWLAASEV